jgi:hypothetical protein
VAFSGMSMVNGGAVEVFVSVVGHETRPFGPRAAWPHAGGKDKACSARVEYKTDSETM